MGKVMSMAKNPFKNFNIESRAHKVISQAKPAPAPKYKADQIGLERLLKDFPEVYQDSLKKNPELNKNLRDVYVTSQPEIPKPPENPNRPLPSDRSGVKDYEFGFKEPDKVPLGKVTLRNALKFITDHQADPRKVTAKTVAAEYTLPEETVSNVLKYYKVYEIYVPDNRRPKAAFAGPGKPKVAILKEVRKAIEPGPKRKGS